MVQGAYDLAVVGGGVIGLAHAVLAARSGLKVALVERQARAIGASIRNFGFITVTGQQRGEVWRMARRSCQIWQEIAPAAGIDILQRGLALHARYPESQDVLDAFLATEMGEGCRVSPSAETAMPFAARGWVLRSPHEVRVESRDAIPALSRYLVSLGGDVICGTAVTGIESGCLHLSGGELRAERIVVCPGDDFQTLFPGRLAGLSRCQLQMLRLADPGFRLPSPVMSDLGLVRYLGYADLPEAATLKARLEQEKPDHLANGVHLIVVQSADGSLIVGDSHHYDAAPEPFASEAVDDLILDEYAAVLGAPPPVLARWTGTYAVASDRLFLIDEPMPDVRLVVVTCGAGASLSFGLAERVLGHFEGEIRVTH